MALIDTLRRGWRALTLHQEWNIGIIDAPVSAFMNPDFKPDIQWLPAPASGKFVADPFMLEHAGVPYLLYEDFDIRNEHGKISAFRILDNFQVEACGPVLCLDTHLAYPFVFECDGRIYCVPESAGENEIALYRLDRIPGELERVCVLVADIQGIDPTVFEYEDRWWLACTDRDTGSNDALKLFYSDSLTGPWKPHSQNPVKSDTSSSRPAGRPFEFEGALYRPAQDCSRTYGGRIAINRITALSPDAFSEEVVRWIEPDSSGCWSKGIHTINGVGKISVVDGKRERFIPAAAAAAIRRNFFGRTTSRPEANTLRESRDRARIGAMS